MSKLKKCCSCRAVFDGSRRDHSPFVDGCVCPDCQGRLEDLDSTERLARVVLAFGFDLALVTMAIIVFLCVYIVAMSIANI